MNPINFKQFGLSDKQIIEKEGTYYFAIQSLVKALSVSRQNIYQTIARNKEDFDIKGVNLKLTPLPDKLTPFSGDLKASSDTSGGVQEHSFLSEQQVYILLMLMRRSEKAKLFRRALSAYLVYKRKQENSYSPVMVKLINEMAELRSNIIATHKKKISQKRIDHLFRLVFVEGLPPNLAGRYVGINSASGVTLCKKQLEIINAREEARLLSDTLKPVGLL